jgi:hypothetical protein
MDGVVTTAEIEAGASHINLNWHEKLAPIIIFPGCFLDPSVIELRISSQVQEHSRTDARISPDRDQTADMIK